MQPQMAHGALKRLSLSGAAASLALWCAASAAQEPATVRAIQPEYRAFTHASAQPAVAEAFYEADLGAKVSGFVAELAVDVGSRVTAGQMLARIAVPEITEARNAARAEVAARASEHERTVMLAERNSVTQKALTEAKSRLDAAVAALAEVDAQLEYATIQAPFAGVVTARSIDPGDMVFEASSPKGGDQPLLKVAKLDVIRVKTYVPERDAVWVDIDDAATIVFDAMPGVSFVSKVARTSGAIDPGTRTMLVEIDLPNDDGRIRPGSYGQTRIALESRDRALALPSSAVRFGDGDAHVFVVAGSSARRTNVITGLNVGGWIEVLSGLTEADRVIATPPANLTDGATIRIAAQ
jgi:RND family efflux transporter MFP subunit